MLVPVVVDFVYINGTHIPKNKELNNKEKEYILNLLMTWIKKELINNTN